MAKKTFDQSLKALEKIVQELETGDLPLEKALKKFDEGIELSRLCSTMLDETEKKVSQLIGKDKEIEIASPFEPDSNIDDP